MRLHVLSDLHLGAGGGARLFHDARQGRRLAEMCARAFAGPEAEVVLLGDTFDFTAMMPPARGLEEFGRALGVPLEARPEPSLGEMCAAVREANPLAVDAISQLAERIPVTLVPGNHDRHLADPAAPAALAAVGLGRARLAPFVALRMAGRAVVLQHGHAFDHGNATPTGGGEALTRALHHGVVPFLRHRGARSHVRADPERLVSLRPEEAAVPVLQRWLDPPTFDRFLAAFLRLLARNGGAPAALAWLADAVPSGVVRRRIREADDLWRRSGEAALSALAGRRALPGGAPRPDVLVLGHTHVLDWAIDSSAGLDRLYVNLGTWTDRTFDVASPPDTSLPLLVLSDERDSLVATLHDVSGPDRELQRFAARPP